MGNANATTLTPPPSPELVSKMPKLAEFQVCNLYFGPQSDDDNGTLYFVLASNK